MMNDLISRQMAIDAIWDGINMDIYTKEVKEILEELPTAEPRTGKWIEEDIHSNWSDWTLYFCSECGRQFKDLEERNYCPNCGAKMEKNND